MRRFFSILSLCVAVLFACGCENKPKAPADAPVKGKVTLDGKPMPEGEITFSVEGGYAPSVMEVKEGAFSGMAKEGQNKVAVRMYKAGPPLSTDPDKKPTKLNTLPDKYNASTTLKAEVKEAKAGGANEFTFAVTSN